MKTNSLLLLCCFCALSGCAAFTDKRLVNTPTQPTFDNRTYCYLDGKPYSKGAVANGKKCSRAGMLIEDGKPGPLSWE